MQDNYVIITCPHCEIPIMVLKKEFNCKIFRHGVFKNTYKQMNPHLPKKDCDKLVVNDLIIGCGKPFKLVIKNNEYTTEICDYNLNRA